ncbi:MAG: TerD family protein [Bacteroidales bacterium]|nr:TerD family protein [Bacteroidales bacterium]MCD8394588.1 TerD family protein [Bacteroidales bacterium]
MAKKFDLKKGERFALGKGDELSLIQVDLNWRSGADLDAVAFLLNDDGVISEDADFVYYKSNSRSEPYDRTKYGSKKNWRDQTVPMSSDGSVLGSADDLGDGDDESGGDEAGETMHVDLAKVRPGVTEIVFCVTIYDEEGKTSFRDVRDPRIVITNEETGEELCSYDLKEKFSSETAVIAGALVLNEDGDWEFEAVGNGYEGGLETLVDMYQ